MPRLERRCWAARRLPARPARLRAGRRPATIRGGGPGAARLRGRTTGASADDEHPERRRRPPGRGRRDHRILLRPGGRRRPVRRDLRAVQGPGHRGAEGRGPGQEAAGAGRAGGRRGRAAGRRRGRGPQAPSPPPRGHGPGAGGRGGGPQHRHEGAHPAHRRVHLRRCRDLREGLHPPGGQAAAAPRVPGLRASSARDHRGRVPGSPGVRGSADDRAPEGRAHPDRRPGGRGAGRALRVPDPAGLPDRQRLPREGAERAALHGGGVHRHRPRAQRRALRR